MLAQSSADVAAAVAFAREHYARLTQVKHRYDPGGLFSVHHGVGTET